MSKPGVRIREKGAPAYRATGKAVKPREVRTNIVLDMNLIEAAKAKFQVNTAREAVQAALEASVRTYDYQELLAAYGSGGIEHGYDPKVLYGRRKGAA